MPDLGLGLLAEGGPHGPPLWEVRQVVADIVVVPRGVAEVADHELAQIVAVVEAQDEVLGVGRGVDQAVVEEQARLGAAQGDGEVLAPERALSPVVAAAVERGPAVGDGLAGHVIVRGVEAAQVAHLEAVAVAADLQRRGDGQELELKAEAGVVVVQPADEVRALHGHGRVGLEQVFVARVSSFEHAADVVHTGLDGIEPVAPVVAHDPGGLRGRARVADEPEEPAARLELRRAQVLPLVHVDLVGAAWLVGRTVVRAVEVRDPGQADDGARDQSDAAA